MMLDIKHEEERFIVRKLIVETVSSLNDKLQIRGSFKFGDFHLDNENIKITFSDLDLLLIGKRNIKKEVLIKEIEGKLKPTIEVKVSIHEADYFPGIELVDSKIKNILEYCIQYRKNPRASNNLLNYYRAKTLLLLLKREENNQRYHDIYLENQNICIRNLFRIKLGYEKDINLTFLNSFVHDYKDDRISEFYSCCVINNPSLSYQEKILSHFLETKTIHKWLKCYISRKFELVEK